MACSQQDKAFCVLQFANTESWTCVQCVFCKKFEKEAPERKSIVRWHAKFVKDGCLCPSKRTGRPSTSEDAVEQVRTAFQRSPRKSVRRAGRELQLAPATVWRVFRKRLKMVPYKLKLVQKLKDTAKCTLNTCPRFSFCKLEDAKCLVLLRERHYCTWKDKTKIISMTKNLIKQALKWHQFHFSTWNSS